VEVDRSDGQDRRRQGKSDPLDAVSAARAAQSGRARGAPKGRDGAVEAIRALMVAKRSARSERTQANCQARALIVTGPDDLRARFTAHATADLVAELAALRPRPGAVVGYHTRIALRELGRRAEFLDSQITGLDTLIVPLVTGHAPDLLALHGVGACHVPGQAGAVAAGALDPDQAHCPEPGQPAQQPGIPGRSDGELPDSEQPADRIQRGRDVGIGVGVHAAGNSACLYDGHCHLFSLIEEVARTRWPSDPVKPRPLPRPGRSDRHAGGCRKTWEPGRQIDIRTA
jgi:hypothetical protein